MHINVMHLYVVGTKFGLCPIIERDNMWTKIDLTSLWLVFRVNTERNGTRIWHYVSHFKSQELSDPSCP